MNTVCTEHEWELRIMTITGGNSVTSTVCTKCGESWPHFINNLEIGKPIYFHIKENLEVINKQEWEDIWDEYKISQNFHLDSIFDWLKENYFAPEKK